MSRQSIDPVLRAAVRAELEQLANSRAGRGTQRFRSSRDRRQMWLGSWFVTAVVAVLVIAVSLVAINSHRPGGSTPASTTSEQSVATWTSDAGADQSRKLAASASIRLVSLTCSGGGKVRMVVLPSGNAVDTACKSGVRNEGGIELRPNSGAVEVRVSGASSYTRWRVKVTTVSPR